MDRLVPHLVPNELVPVERTLVNSCVKSRLLRTQRSGRALTKLPIHSLRRKYRVLRRISRRQMVEPPRSFLLPTRTVVAAERDEASVANTPRLGNTGAAFSYTAGKAKATTGE